MGVIQDFVDGLQTWIENLFKDGIKSQFSSIGDLIKTSFDPNNSDTGVSVLVSNFLTTHPANFTGASGSSGTTIWQTIETLCNNAVVPIAGIIFAILMINDLIQMVLRGNNFKDFDDSIFVKWIIKTLCGTILISNVYYIASALFGFGVSATSAAMTTLFNTSVTDVSLNKNALDGLSIGELISTWLISIIVYLGVIIMIVAIVIVLASRIIEVFMYLGISPIPVATLVDGGEFGSVGKNWIKQLIALSFQGFFIIVAIGIFKTLFNNAISTINSGSGSVTMQMVFLLGYTCALVFTVLRTGAISKSAFNAH